VCASVPGAVSGSLRDCLGGGLVNGQSSANGVSWFVLAAEAADRLLVWQAEGWCAAWTPEVAGPTARGAALLSVELVASGHDGYEATRSPPVPEGVSVWQELPSEERRPGSAEVRQSWPYDAHPTGRPSEGES
jgi:hypothetical protein